MDARTVDVEDFEGAVRGEVVVVAGGMGTMLPVDTCRDEGVGVVGRFLAEAHRGDVVDDDVASGRMRVRACTAKSQRREDQDMHPSLNVGVAAAGVKEVVGTANVGVDDEAASVVVIVGSDVAARVRRVAVAVGADEGDART